MAKAIAERQRRVHEFDIAGFFNLKGEAIPKLGIQVPTKTEQDKALVEAHKAIAHRVGDVESAKSDDDIIRDKKIVHILHKACVDPTPKDSGGGVIYHDPIFPSPGWMEDRLKTDEIAILLNLLNEARRIEGSEPDLDDATVEHFVGVVSADVSRHEVAELLAACGREFVALLFVSTARKLVDARVQLAAHAVQQDAEAQSQESTNAGEG